MASEDSDQSFGHGPCIGRSRTAAPNARAAQKRHRNIRTFDMSLDGVGGDKPWSKASYFVWL
jgi:hypothetical protein